MSRQKVPDDYKQTQISCRTSRVFSIRFLKFSNGCFISLSEDYQKIGSLYVSSANSNKVSTAKVIASKSNSIFLTSITERVALMVNGFAIVNLSSNGGLSRSDMEDVLDAILKLID
jgi:hypothetical protein